jgi:hypothetical protein
MRAGRRLKGVFLSPQSICSHIFKMRFHAAHLIVSLTLRNAGFNLA